MALKRKLSSGFSDGLISPNFKQIREQAEFDLAWYWLTKEKRTPSGVCRRAKYSNRQEKDRECFTFSVLFS